MAELDKAYDPKATEDRIYKMWDDGGFFKPVVSRKSLVGKAKRFVIHLPPPNVTGSLHMGHALNATISDILIRYHRMNGDETVWFPGTDHAGIATQSVVDKQLKKEGISRWELGREKFVEKVWEWREKYGNIIIGQLKKIGASADWSRVRFTMDPEYAEWVKKVFIHYHEKGWIYRGKRVVSWCTACQTSLSDLEIEYKEEKTKLWNIKYPLTNDGRPTTNDEPEYITVATTRPETMLGDTAVAVNPKDDRYKNLVGKKVLLPIQNREIPIIADAKIDLTFGTGAVKVTPAHDLLDAEIGERHKLPFIQVINERGKMTAEAGKEFEGLKIAEAREKVVAELEKLGLIVKTEDYDHNLAICSRSATPIEPLLSDQWFLKMEKLAATALKAVTSEKTRIIPENFSRPYVSWLENIRDWCISRQIWWGHQLPVYFCKTDPTKFIVATEKPAKCPECKNCEMEQSQDVLDTWFSSALWPFAGLSEEDQKKFYPSSVLITARDIINLWVGRMIFSGVEFMGETPFPDVLIHATVLTKDGKRMSKSLGTGIDPMDLIEKYGADATRFGIIWQAMGTQDIHWDEAAVQAGKKFANKLWNIARFVQGRMGATSDLRLATSDAPEDQEILAKLETLKKEVEQGIAAYDFGQTLHKIYDFVWHELADKYIEATKSRTDENVKIVLGGILMDVLRILHPFMPFITEELHQRLSGEGALIAKSWSGQ
ncbi:MAG: valyl-tRNA synthetase [Parcubacteria group bacterium Gr01-1014_19]|nr:MAG: valyl-tRNA synthetase [Parcubacteria group bacterium Gr01-1014_19]